MRTAFAAAVTLTLALAAAAQPIRVELENGAVALLAPIEGAGSVGVQACYEAGIVDDPPGMAQAVHLLEHLQIHSAVGNEPAGDAFRRLSALGLINAETLGDFVHYDYVFPAGQLRQALEAERDRMKALRIEPDVIAVEGPRAAAEVGAVAAAPQRPLGKFALMAAMQAWKGEESAAIQSGLEAMDPKALETLRTATHHPGRLLIAVTGGFDAAEATAILRDTIGALPAGAARPEPLDYEAIPAHSTITWDVNATAVIVAYPPPRDPAERLALSLWGAGLQMRLMQRPELQGRIASALGSSNVWPVGRLPCFVGAVLEPGADPKQVADALDALMRDPAQNDPLAAQTPFFAHQVGAAPILTPQALETQVETFARMRGMAPAEAERLIIGNAALQLAIRERLLGNEADLAARAAEMLGPEGRRALLARLDPDSRFVTVLTPEHAKPDRP